MGLVGTLLVGRWAWGLLRECGAVLLDANVDATVAGEVRDAVASLGAGAALRDLHVWRVGRGKYACILSLETGVELTTHEVRRALSVRDDLVHVTVGISDRRA